MSDCPIHYITTTFHRNFFFLILFYYFLLHYCCCHLCSPGTIITTRVHTSTVLRFFATPKYNAEFYTMKSVGLTSNGNLSKRQKRQEKRAEKTNMKNCFENIVNKISERPFCIRQMALVIFFRLEWTYTEVFILYGRRKES